MTEKITVKDNILTQLKIKGKDFECLQRIIQYKGTNTDTALSEIIQHAEEEELDEVAYDEAVRSVNTYSFYVFEFTVQ